MFGGEVVDVLVSSEAGQGEDLIQCLLHLLHVIIFIAEVLRKVF